jgi:hypothetical protein
VMREFKVRFSREELSEAFDGFNALGEVIPTRLLYSYSRVRVVLDKLEYFAGPPVSELGRGDACRILEREPARLVEGLSGDSGWVRGRLCGLMDQMFFVRDSDGSVWGCSSIRTVEGD